MLNLETKAIIHSRDIISLHKMHKDWVKVIPMKCISSEDDSTELPIGMRINKSENNKTNIEITHDEKDKTNEKVFRETKKLES
jgi:hypothetical protein